MPFVDVVEDGAGDALGGGDAVFSAAGGRRPGVAPVVGFFVTVDMFVVFWTLDPWGVEFRVWMRW
jgi:hypothetical protein